MLQLLLLPLLLVAQLSHKHSEQSQSRKVVSHFFGIIGQIGGATGAHQRPQLFVCMFGRGTSIFVQLASVVSTGSPSFSRRSYGEKRGRGGWFKR